jgi:hypothetical protein
MTMAPGTLSMAALATVDPASPYTEIWTSQLTSSPSNSRKIKRFSMSYC